MGGEIKLSVLIAIAAEQARRELSATAGELDALAAGADTAGQKAGTAGQQIDQTGTAARGAGAAVDELTAAVATAGQRVDLTGQHVANFGSTVLGSSAALNVLAQAGTQTIAQQANFAAGLVQASTALAGARDATTGLTAAIRDQVQDMLAARREADAWQASLDSLRARFNPLFAVSRQYEQELRDIAEAERVGAISSLEAASARERAAQSMAPLNAQIQKHVHSLGAARAANANLVAQGNDIIMMAMAGQSPLMLALQQGTQVSQVMAGVRAEGASVAKTLGSAFVGLLNPMTIATIAIIGFGAAGVQWLSTLGTKTKSFDDNLKDLNTTLDRMRGRFDLLGNTRLSETFGNLSALARGMTQDMLTLDRAAELKQLKATIDTFMKKDVEPSFLQKWSLAIAQGQTGAYGAGVFTEEAVASDNYAKLGAANSFEDFSQRQSEIVGLAEAGKVEDVLAKLQELQSAMAGGGPFTGMSEELQDHLVQLNDWSLKTAAIEAMWNGSALAEKIKNQIDTMTTGYRQQAELAEAAARFGERSAQVDDIRARHARENLAIRLEDMKVVKGSTEALAAQAALEREIAADAAKRRAQIADSTRQTFADLLRQSQVSIAILTHGEDSAEVEAIRAQHAREILTARLEELGLAPGLIAFATRLFDVERERANAIKAAGANRQAQDMLTDLRDQAAISQAILVHGENSVQVKELQIAAERRSFEQQLATLKVSEALKGELRAAWEAAEGLASVDPFGVLAAGQEYLRAQQDRLDKLQLELSLIGQTEAAKSRALALAAAEREIRDRGIGATSAVADQMRTRAIAEAELTQALERQSAAWGKVQSSAESAIDSIVNSGLKGDVEGMLDGIAQAITGTFAELAVANPIKNALLGTDLGTLADVGGLGGIWDRFTGKAESQASPGATVSSMSVASMAVTAASVTLTGALGTPTLGSAANLNGAPFAAAAGGLTGSADVQSQVWSYFAGKGLQPHQIAGIMGNISGESGFNALSVGDGGTSFGLFQHHASRAQGLFDSIGGQGNLGNVQAQLDFAWKELMTTHRGAYEGLMNSRTPAEATDVWMRKFEVPSQDAIAQSWPNRLGAAEEAMARFGATTQTTTANLGTLGTGFEGFGNMLGQALSGGGAGGGGLMGALANGFAGMLGIPGFATGGWTGGDDPSQIAGVVHGREYVFDAAATARIGVPTLEAMRKGGVKGYATGGYVTGGRPVMPVGMAPASAPVIQFAPVINPVNNASVPLQMQVEETTDARGQRQYNLVMSDAVAAGISTPGGKADRTMRSRYGVQRKGMPR